MRRRRRNGHSHRDKRVDIGLSFPDEAEKDSSLHISVKNLLCLGECGAIPLSRQARLPFKKTGLYKEARRGLGERKAGQSVPVFARNRLWHPSPILRICPWLGVFRQHET